MSTLVVLFGIIIVLKVAAETWLENRERKQRRTFYQDEYLKSDEWRRKRALVLKRDRYQCVRPAIANNTSANRNV